MKLYAVVLRLNGLDMIREIRGVFEDLSLAEVCRARMEKESPPRAFTSSFSVVPVDLIRRGSPEANKIMLGG